MIDAGEIGRVLHIEGFGPHFLNPSVRPDWFFQREKYGGILCDIGSHQVESYLFYTGEENATVTMSRIGNFAHPEYPELEDFGDCALIGENGTTHYFRVDWRTPKSWGDGHTLIIGTNGYIDIKGGNYLFLDNGISKREFDANGAGCPFCGRLILDSLNRTEYAMTQQHTFKAAELSLLAQAQAQTIKQTDTLPGRHLQQ